MRPDSRDTRLKWSNPRKRWSYPNPNISSHSDRTSSTTANDSTHHNDHTGDWSTADQSNCTKKTPQGTQNRAQPRRQLYPVNQPRYIGDTNLDFCTCCWKCLKNILAIFVYPPMLQFLPGHGQVDQSGTLTRSKNCNKSDQ